MGGGVLGCAAAYYLAHRGVETVVVERGALNREASGANAGTLHIQIPASHFRAQYLESATASERQADFQVTNRLYAAAAQAWYGIERDLDADLGVRMVGGLMVAESDREMEVLEAKAAYERRIGMQCEVLCRNDTLHLEPCLGPSVVGASYCANEGFANPLLAAPAFIRRAQTSGARLRLHTRVTDIEPSTRGAWFVETSTGPIRARRILIAAGAQTRRVLGLLGLDLPILPHPLQVMVTAPQPPMLRHLLQHAGNRHLSMRQTQYRTFLIGGGWPALESDRRSTSRLEVSYRSLAGNAAVATEVVPALRDVPLIRAWAGMTTSTGRWNRVGFLGEDRRAGLGKLFVLVAGGWGFTLSPVLGQLVAELVADGQTSLDIEPFSLERAIARM